MLARSLLAALAVCALTPATSAAAIHTVAPGETLWGIAMANNLPTSAVATANGLSPDARPSRSVLDSLYAKAGGDAEASYTGRGTRAGAPKTRADGTLEA